MDTWYMRALDRVPEAVFAGLFFTLVALASLLTLGFFGCLAVIFAMLYWSL